VSEAEIPGMFTTPAEVVGQEARVNDLRRAPDRPVRHRPAGADRPQPDRSSDLSQGGDHHRYRGPRDGIAAASAISFRVMNLASRSTVSGYVAEDGTIRVIGGN
jgi:flagella basal body P-ring formation protein FlgA